MEYIYRPFQKDDGIGIIDIFNHYVKNSFAAFPEDEVPAVYFEAIFKETTDFPTVTVLDEDKIIGFGMHRPYKKIRGFSRTTEVSYFIAPDYTGKGIGSKILEFLESGAREKGIKVILASISSFNTGSIRFHEKHGFRRCGRFENIGEKHGKLFDEVWMQKALE